MTTTGTDPAPKIEGEAQQAASTTPSSVADVAAQAGALYAEAIHQLQESSTTLFKHDDAMLTWAIGLMGAGLFYANTLLADAPRGLRFVALAPWIVGILASLAGRVVGAAAQRADAELYGGPQVRTGASHRRGGSAGRWPAAGRDTPVVRAGLCPGERLQLRRQQRRAGAAAVDRMMRR